MAKREGPDVIRFVDDWVFDRPFKGWWGTLDLSGWPDRTRRAGYYMIKGWYDKRGNLVQVLEFENGVTVVCEDLFKQEL